MEPPWQRESTCSLQVWRDKVAAGAFRLGEKVGLDWSAVVRMKGASVVIASMYLQHTIGFFRRECDMGEAAHGPHLAANAVRCAWRLEHDPATCSGGEELAGRNGSGSSGADGRAGDVRSVSSDGLCRDIKCATLVHEGTATIWEGAVEVARWSDTEHQQGTAARRESDALVTSEWTLW